LQTVLAESYLHCVLRIYSLFVFGGRARRKEHSENRGVGGRMGLGWILGSREIGFGGGGCGVDSPGSG
jgi:hypothetical protein